jgi:tetratricopeptide (TPR) repeat protein
MYSPNRVVPLWKLTPVLAALAAALLVGLRLLGVLPDRLNGAPAPEAGVVHTSRPPKVPKAAQGTDLESIIAVRNDILRREPKNIDALVERGDAHAEQKAYDKALADYEEAVHLAPDAAEAYFGRGWVRLQKDDLSGALADFDEAIRLAPEAAEAYAYRGRVHVRRKEYKEAEADFTHALQLERDNTEAYLGRGRLHRDQGDWEQAVADFQKATRLEPELPDGYNELAWLWAAAADKKVRHPDLALEHAGRACQLSDWKDGRCLDVYAAAHASAGNYDQAVRWEKKALAQAEELPKTLVEQMEARLKLYEAHKPYRLP